MLNGILLNETHVNRFTAIDSRGYVPYMNNHECSQIKFDKLLVPVEDCLAKDSHHRCTGVGGGHPDLIAFDVVESLYELFE